MKKNAKDTNLRLDAPLGRLGVPPDSAFFNTGNNVLIIAKLTDSQYDEMIDTLLRLTQPAKLTQ